MRLYDTLTRSLVELPPPPGPIRMYSAARPCTSASTSATRARSSSRCGSGSWLRETGYDVTLVHNITDINDKIYDAAPGASAQLAADATRGTSRTPSELGLGRPDVEPTARRDGPRTRSR